MADEEDCLLNVMSNYCDGIGSIILTSKFKICQSPELNEKDTICYVNV